MPHPRHLTAAILVAVLAVPLALGAGPSTGDRIRSGLPAPDVARPQVGTVQFAGQDAGKRVNVAVVRSSTGAVLAYVCDGKRIGRWLTGRVANGQAVLTNRTGARMTVVFAGGTRVTGTANLGAIRIRFALPRASVGLRRTTARAGGRTFEAAWIVTDTGVTRGLASEDGGKTVATSSAGTNPAADADAGVTTAPGAGSSTPSPTILRKFRCGRLILKFIELRADLRDGDITQAEFDEANQPLQNRLDDLDCSDFFS